MNDLIKVTYYARVSTEKEDQLNSFEMQQTYFKNKLSKTNGFELINGYYDYGLSATKFDREGFLKLIHDAGIDIIKVKKKITFHRSQQREPLFNEIWVKSISRFSRDVTVIALLRELHENKVRVFFEDINCYSDDAQAALQINIFTSIAQQESQTISERVKWGAMRSKEANKLNVPTGLYGFEKVYDDKKELSLKAIEDEAEIVRKVFDLRLNGLGSLRIANQLKEEGVINRKGLPFSNKTIINMLNNPIYAGYNRRNHLNNSALFRESRQTVKPREEWIVQKHEGIEPIITKETFDKVQKVIKEATTSSQKHGKYIGKSEFAGKIVCGSCGTSYTRNSERIKRSYGEYYRAWYNCHAKKKNRSSCDNPNIKEEVLYELVELWCSKDYLRNRSLGVIRPYLELIDKSIVKYDNVDNEELIKLIKGKNEEKIKLQTKLKKLIITFLDQEDDDEVFNEIKTELQNKIIEIENDIKVLNDRVNGVSKIKEKYNYLKLYLIDEVNNIESEITKNKFINEYLHKITVNNEGKLIIETKLDYIIAKAFSKELN